ncbi:MAG: CRISPR-associated endonuclease Cas1 [bacterium]|nr:CRISPR-associated endonuclease Cas1 [bacterium]
MIRKFEYCHRLFYLEWVRAEFEDNADTVEGRYNHRVVDRSSGRMGSPTDENLVKSARSVLISSERLGLIARVDMIEGGDGTVIPVEYKRGQPPHGPQWTPELAQLYAIGLVLRDQGYNCSQGVMYFTKTRRRVTIEFDSELLDQVESVVHLMRRVASTPQIPPPLVDSPKCAYCSLVGICLPDETNLHTRRSAKRPRRLTPRDSAARPLYVTEQGAKIGIRGGRVRVTRHNKELQQVRAIDVSQISVFGNVQLSSQLMRAAFSRQIPVCWFSYGGWFQGVAHGLPSKHVELRRRQVAIAAQAGLPIAKRLVEGKIRNCRTFLRRNSRADTGPVLAQLKQMADQTADVQSVESLLGLEGAAARLYFERFGGMLKNDPPGTFDVNGRNRRPPRDPVNCLLSYAYSLLTKDLTATVLGVGFDPYLGVYHRPRFGRPALALDLAEEFRPLIADSVVVNVINNGEIQSNGFVVRAQGVAMNQQARRSFLAAYERRLDHQITHPTYKYRITYRRVLEVQARMLGAYLLGEIPEYVPFMTR